MVFRTRADALEATVTASEAVKDAVGTMVRQFADPLAFYRELVQNSIDAGATAIDVRIRYDGDDDSLTIAVHDDGAGMNLEIIERCLLVLFRSSKDKDPSKIGKFGVGFFSVFAVAPKIVRVDTGTGSDGFRVELRGDYTYEVTESSPRKGTTVSITVAMRLGEARSFVERSMAALERWCPHVEIPLHVLSTVRGGEVDKRVDRPFGIEGSPSVMVKTPVATIALTVAQEGRAAFYKRGILLFECPNTFFAGVSFKAEAPRLVHTVSRDNVKRDAAFAQVINAIEGAIRTDLAGAVVTAARVALTEAMSAASAANGGSTHIQEAQSRAARALRAVATMAQDFALDVPLPLCDPEPSTSERVYLGPSSRLKYWSSSPDALTLALSRQKQPVLWTHCLGEAHADFFRGQLEPSACDARTRFCAVAPRDGTLEPEEEALLEATRKLLGAVDVPLVRAVEVAGVGSDTLFLAVDTSDLASATRYGLVFDGADVTTKLFNLFTTRACAINRAHPSWQRALAASEVDRAFAALAFARLVLLYAAKLDATRDARLFDKFTSID